MSRRLLVVDPRVVGYEEWLAGLDLLDSDVLILDVTQDGVQQVADYMRNQEVAYDSLHIVSHGTSGTLYLGSTVLTQTNLDSYSPLLGHIGAGLTDFGDILLYGCDVASGSAGQQFVERISELTDADVAASFDKTGSVQVNGNSSLEVQTGFVETVPLVSGNLPTLLAVNSAPDFAMGDGMLTTSITGWDDKAYSISLQADGKILVAGTVSIDNWRGMALVRYNRDGSLDTTFGNAGVNTPSIGTRNWDSGQSVAVQADGKILVAGSADTGVIGSNSDFALVRYDSNGNLDTTFSEDGKQTTNIGGSSSTWDEGYSVLAQSDGKILVAGLTGPSEEIAVVRYLEDGSLDTTFSTNGIQTTGVTANDVKTCSVMLQTDGKILVAGTSTNYARGAFNEFALVRLNSDGSFDTTFSEDGKLTTAIGSTSDNYGQCIALQSDGKIVVAGFMVTGTFSYSDFVLLRYNTDGSLDTTFNGNGRVITGISLYDLGYSVTLQKDGKILVAGATRANSSYDFALIRYNSNGSLDTSFSSDGVLTTAIGLSEDIGYDVAVQSDGKILVSGASKNYSYDFALARYNQDGSLDRSFDARKIANHVGTQNYTENSVAVVLDSTYVISDAELDAIDNYSGSSIFIARHGGANPEDRFSIGGNFSELVENNFLIYDQSTIIGRVNRNSEGALEIVFINSVSQSLVNNVLQSIRYSNTSDNPSPSVQIDLTFNDGNTGAQGTGSAQSVTGSTTVYITAVNDAPSGGNGVKIVSANNSYTLSAADFGFADAEDGSTLTAVRIDSLPSQGKVYYMGGWVTTPGLTFTASDLTNGKLTYTSATLDGTITFSVKDSSGTYDPTSNTLVFRFNRTPTGSPTIDGAIQQGATLAVISNFGDEDGIGTITYTWKAANTTIGTGNTYTLTQAEVGKTITVTANYTDGYGTTENVSSAASDVVANTNDLPTGAVAITGEFTQGEVLTASHTLADLDGLGTISYAWKAGGAVIGTGATYTLTQSEVGKIIIVTATYTDGFSTVESVNSSATNAIANINDAPTGTVSISGTAATGQTLTASNNLSDPDGLGSITYTWKSNGTTVATGGSYTPGVADMGNAITVTASYTDGYLTSEGVTSAATAGVTSFQMVTASFTGSSVDEWIVGTGANNTINAGAGNDVLDGAGGVDSLAGGAGNDRYIVDLTAAGALQDTVTEAASAGTDSIQLRGNSTNTTVATITLGSNLENLDASGTSSSLLNFAGNALDNSIVGNSATNVLTGGTGADSLDGGNGSDVYIVAATAEHGVAEFTDTGASGTDEIRFTSTTASTLTLYAGDTGIEQAVIGTGTSATATTSGTTTNSINASALTYGITLIGNSGANTLTGGSGNDTLNGGAGSDSLVGGAGNDTYVVDVTTDVVNETVTGNGGTDTVQAAVTYTLGTNLENLTLTGTTAINGTGNTLGNSLLGNSAANVLTGAGGADTLDGGSGNDIYFVGTSSDYTGDVINDASGTDELRFAAAAADTLTLTSSVTGIERIVVGTGTATTATTTATTAINVNTAVITTAISITGNAGANSLTSGNGNDSLIGNAGSDTLTGGLGADSLTGGTGSDVFVFSAGQSGQTTSFDTISDLAKGAVGTGDLIDYSAALTIGGSNATATSSQASINTSTGVTIFASLSGTTLSDALADITARFTAATDTAGEFAFFKVNATGNYYLFISDGTAGVTANDVVVQLVGVTAISSINYLASGNLTITA